MAALKEKILKGATLKDVVDHINGLPEASRVGDVLALDATAQKKLFALAGSGTMLSLDQLIPVAQSGREVVFHGKNSLPVFTRFQKRFFRRPDGKIFGYNFQTMTWATGPGYFEVTASPRDGKELLFDYTHLPDKGLAQWPRVKDNRRGLSRFVYGGMNDYVRKVTETCLVGWAFKDGKDIDSTFVLVR